MTRKKLAILGLLGLGALPAHAGAPSDRILGDQKAVLLYRRGLDAAVRYAASRPDLFPLEKRSEKRLLSREQKEALWSVWKTFLDYQLALDSLGKTHQRFWKEHGADREGSLLVFSAAVLARYRHAMAFIARAENDPSLHTVLNESIPELGLPKGTYADLKLRFLNVARAGEYAVVRTLLAAAGGTSAAPSARTGSLRDTGSAPELRAAIAEDSDEILRLGKGTGEALTARNAVAVVKSAGFAAWFPVQAGVSEWMGDVKVYRKTRSLITEAQIQAAHPKLQPGDVFLERREWYLSNIGLPGFWPHAALYVGTADERRAYFADDEGTRAFVTGEGRTDGDLNALLAERYPKAWADAHAPFEGHAPRILEAMSEGVVFTSLEHSAAADSWAVLRPRLSKAEKARALVRAFHLAGRPYDFNFDFLTDDAIVCSELIFKAYEPATGFTGLKLPLVEILGRWAMPPNEMVRQFAEQLGTPAQQTDLVLFLDGTDRQGGAVEAGLEAFVTSHLRPKWHTLK